MGVSHHSRAPGLVHDLTEVFRKEGTNGARPHGRPVSEGTFSVENRTRGLLPRNALPDLVQDGMSDRAVAPGRFRMILFGKQPGQLTWCDPSVGVKAIHDSPTHGCVVRPFPWTGRHLALSDALRGVRFPEKGAAEGISDR